MEHTIGIYRFEADGSSAIHVYEKRTKERYFDMISNREPLTIDQFIYMCKCWYSENVLC